MGERIHYNIRITVEKVEHVPVKVERGLAHATTGETKRVVTEAGKVELKHSDFDTAKNLAGKHLELLTEFDGADPRKGNTRDF